jgi:predicted flap endonuclease-1-like 5' DNA nuclease
VRETLQQLRRDNETLAASHQETLTGREPTRSPVSRRDDLQQIAGIADVLEEKLNELGISTYRQIMELDSAAIAEISRKLGLDDRVVQDDWVGQARRLHHRFHRAA